MQNFIKEAIIYLDPYQLRTLAHTCARLRSASFERMRESAFVRIPDPTNAELTCDVKLTPIDSMLARSSLTSIIGAIDKTRANVYCHSAIAHWFDELWHGTYESIVKRHILIESLCRYDDVEFARVLFSYIISAMRCAYTNVDNQDEHPWYIALRASIPMGPEIARIMSIRASNQTQSMRIFTFLMSRDMYDPIKPIITGLAGNMYKSIFVEAMITDNKQLARAMLDVLVNNTPPRKDQLIIEINREVITSSMVQFCKDNGVTIYLDAPSICLDKEALLERLYNSARESKDECMVMNSALTLVAMDIREQDLVRAIINKSYEIDSAIPNWCIIYMCCCANRTDVVDALIASNKIDMQSLKVYLDMYSFNPIALARLRDLAIRHMHDNPSFVVYATLVILKNTKTVEQVHALLPPRVIAQLARVIRSQAEQIDDDDDIGDTCCKITLPMYDVLCELGFVLEQWHPIIYAIIHSHNVNEIKHMTKLLPDITTYKLSECIIYCRTHYRHSDLVCSRDIDQESMHYLVSRLSRHSKSRSCDMFMLGLLFNNREIMLESKYCLRADDCDWQIGHIVDAYMRENPSISEFFMQSERFACYMKLITYVDQFCQHMLLSELSINELLKVSKYKPSYETEHKINSIELIATAMLRAMAKVYGH